MVEQSKKIFCAKDGRSKFFFAMVEETHCGKPRALQLSFTEPPSGTACDYHCEELNIILVNWEVALKNYLCGNSAT